MREQDLGQILAQTRDLWAELRGQRIFITGGTCFIGRWLLESFSYANSKLDLKAEATVLSRNPDAFLSRAPGIRRDPSISFCRGDIRSFAFPEKEHAFIIHGAAASGADREAEGPLARFDTIVSGTGRTLEFASKTGCRKLLFISSGAVYGKQPPEMTHIPESYPGGPDTMDPASDYGEGKRAAELLCALAHKRGPGLETKIARCFAFVGPDMPLDSHFAIGNFIRDAAAGGPVLVKGDGTPCRSYLYASDLAVWLWTILFRGRPCRPYNVGSGKSVSILETANAAAGQASPPLAVKVAQPPCGGQPQRYVPDVSRAESELGLTVTVGLSEAISRTMPVSKGA
ncbi:MAG: NAD-dependent epimerase/dehydratase family protein [Elusimicrobiales bacterium]|nr:NAD-dependent epimerase/dehydratase family protein [Elusimicrobiales bacterium]